MDALDFIRTQLGRMSDAQIMRNLGLRDSDYRELRAMALVKHATPPVPVGRGHDRVHPNRRPAVVRPPAERAIELLLARAGRRLEQITTPQDDAETATRDLLVWLLRSLCGKSPGAIGRLLGMTEYSAGLNHRRYDALVMAGMERPEHAAWRQEICALLAPG